MYEVFSPYTGLTLYRTRFIILAWFFELRRPEMLDREYVDTRRAG